MNFNADGGFIFELYTCVVYNAFWSIELSLTVQSLLSWIFCYLSSLGKAQDTFT